MLLAWVVGSKVELRNHLRLLKFIFRRCGSMSEVGRWRQRVSGTQGLPGSV